MNNKCRVTVVCCYNNQDKLQEQLLMSLHNQNEPYVFLPIDNVKGQFSSCSTALNSILAKINTEYVIFAHQDIVFTESTQLGQFVDYMQKGSEGDIFGIAGVYHNSPGVMTCALHGSNRKPAGRFPIVGLRECDTIDECFFGGMTKTFLDEPFDERICDNWHLYAVELCLRAKKNNKKVYVCAIPLLHLSTGIVTPEFYKSFLKLCKSYHSYYPIIRTTCAANKTDFFSRNKTNVRIRISHVRSIIRHIFPSS